MSEKTTNDLFERFAKRLVIAHNINPAVDKELLAQIFWYTNTPKKYKAGFQTRNDTYSGKLAYVIYYDEKSV